MASTLDSISSDLGLSSGRGHCVVLFAKAFNSHSALVSSQVVYQRVPAFH